MFFVLLKPINLLLFALLKPEQMLIGLTVFCKKISKDWEWAAILSDGFSGGIIVFWHKSIGTVTPLASSRRALHIIISHDITKTFLISIIYNLTRFRSLCVLWHELLKLSSLQVPWLVVGDFNSILHRTEHMGGPFTHYDRKARFFCDFVENNNMIDLNYSGPHFTWCNNQLGLAHRWARLDRCLINLVWADFFKINKFMHLPRLISDHSPVLLAYSPSPTSFKNIFRFNNNWFDFIGCHDAVREAWTKHFHGNPMHAFSHLLSCTRSKLSVWRRSGVN